MTEAATIDQQEATTGTGAAVSAVGLKRTFGTGDAAVEALRGVDVTFPRGQFAAVMGPSGSGKSTLMHLLAGLDAPTAGTVEIDGREITTMGDAELTRLRRDRIGFVFQFFNLLPMLSAEQNVELPLKLAGRSADPGWIEKLLASVGLADRSRHQPVRALGRSAAARRRRPRAGQQAGRRVRRRAHRQPRLQDERRDPRAHAPVDLRVRPDDRDRHA